MTDKPDSASAAPSLESLRRQLRTYRQQQTRFFNRPTDEELALSNACEDRENALMDWIDSLAG